MSGSDTAFFQKWAGNCDVLVYTYGEVGHCHKVENLRLQEVRELLRLLDGENSVLGMPAPAKPERRKAVSGLYAIDVTTFEDAGRFGRCMRRIPRTAGADRPPAAARGPPPLIGSRMAAGGSASPVFRAGVARAWPVGTGKTLCEGMATGSVQPLPCGNMGGLCGGYPPGRGGCGICPAGQVGGCRAIFSRRRSRRCSGGRPKEAQDTVFARIWTRKEAYLKYTGEGLSHPLSTFSPASPDEDGRPVWDPALGCFFTSYTLPDGTPLALCTQDGFVPPSIALLRVE